MKLDLSVDKRGVEIKQQQHQQRSDMLSSICSAITWHTQRFTDFPVLYLGAIRHCSPPMKSPREKGRAREIESERGDERRWQRPVGDEVHLVVLVCDLEEEEAALLLCACKFIIIISTAQLSSDRARSTVLYFTAASKGGAEKEGQDAKVEPAGVGRSVGLEQYGVQRVVQL